MMRSFQRCYNVTKTSGKGKLFGKNPFQILKTDERRIEQPAGRADMRLFNLNVLTGRAVFSARPSSN